MPKTRVVVVAGYASVRAGLHALISADPDLDMIGDVPTGGPALVRLLPTLRADVLVLDTTGDSASSDGVARILEALTAYNEENPAVAHALGFVVVGDAPEMDLPRLQSAALAGWGYLLRDAEGPQIIGAVRAAAAGLVALDPTLQIALAEDPVAPRAASIARGDEVPGETLTPREIEVLDLMAQGLPNKIIATRLKISIHTAKFHVAQILGKFDAASRTEAVTVGARRGYIAF